MAEVARRRSDRANHAQLNALVDAVSRDRSLHTERFSGPNGKLTFKEKWEQLGHLLNCIGPSKEWAQWRQAWRDLKNKTRKHSIALARAARGVGNSKNTPLPPLSDLERKVVAIVSDHSASKQDFVGHTLTEPSYLSQPSTDYVNYASTEHEYVGLPLAEATYSGHHSADSTFGGHSSTELDFTSKMEVGDSNATGFQLPQPVAPRRSTRSVPAAPRVTETPPRTRDASSLRRHPAVSILKPSPILVTNYGSNGEIKSPLQTYRSISGHACATSKSDNREGGDPLRSLDDPPSFMRHPNTALMTAAASLSEVAQGLHAVGEAALRQAESNDRISENLLVGLTGVAAAISYDPEYVSGRPSLQVQEPSVLGEA